MMRLRVAIVGGSGYIGGELLRLLLDHPHVEVTQVTSESQAGKFIYSAHPNLRGRTALRFLPLVELSSSDLVFACLPHSETMTRIDALSELAPRLIDLSADFRLRDAALYESWYAEAHTAPDWLPWTTS